MSVCVKTEMDEQPHTRTQDNSDRSLTGSTLGEYRLLDYLGEGAIGVVYRAEHKGSGQQVAVKVLKPTVARHPDMVVRFVQQARILCENITDTACSVK